MMDIDRRRRQACRPQQQMYSLGVTLGHEDRHAASAGARDLAQFRASSARHKLSAPKREFPLGTLAGATGWIVHRVFPTLTPDAYPSMSERQTAFYLTAPIVSSYYEDFLVVRAFTS
jgi:hypothetical protein